MKEELKNVSKRRRFELFKDFGYRVIKLKYFIIISIAMLLEIITLVLYMLNNEEIFNFGPINAGIIYGVTSLIVIILAVISIVLLNTDKSRDRKKISQLGDFKRNCFELSSEYSDDINNFVKNFDSERESIESKINYAIEISEKYDKYIKEFLKIKVPPFLKDAFEYKLDNLRKEKLFFNEFSLLADPERLEVINKESDQANNCFLKEMSSIEKNLSIII
jgi:hypothetical protein